MVFYAGFSIPAFFLLYIGCFPPNGHTFLYMHSLPTFNNPRVATDLLSPASPRQNRYLPKEAAALPPGSVIAQLAIKALCGKTDTHTHPASTPRVAPPILSVIGRKSELSSRSGGSRRCQKKSRLSDLGDFDFPGLMSETEAGPERIM